MYMFLYIYIHVYLHVFSTCIYSYMQYLMWILWNHTKKTCVKSCPVEMNHSHNSFRNRLDTTCT